MNSDGFVFEDPAKNPREKANFISRLFLRYNYCRSRTLYSHRAALEVLSLVG